MLTSFLISFLGKRIGLAIGHFLPYILGVLAIVVIGWLIYDKGYDRGVEVTDQKYKTAIEEERHRQIEANNVALQAALDRQLELEQLLAKRDAELQTIFEEGSDDPDADRPAIGTGSVQRINRIR